jgi:hypothetical protein
MAIRLHSPDWLGGVPWLSWGRIRYIHTQGLFFGWLGNAFLAFLYYDVPRLAGRPVTSTRVGWALFLVWNGLIVLPGWAMVQAGVSQPLEWAEFPLPNRRGGFRALRLLVRRPGTLAQPDAPGPDRPDRTGPTDHPPRSSSEVRGRVRCRVVTPRRRSERGCSAIARSPGPPGRLPSGRPR